MELPHTNQSMQFEVEFETISDMFKYLMFGILLVLVVCFLVAITLMKNKNGVLEKELRNDLTERQMRDQIA